MDCPLLDVSLDPQEVTAVLLVDQSESMTADFSGAPRWDAVRTTLFNDVDGVVTTLEGEIRFGLTLYTSMDGDMGGACPILTESAPALNNAADMQMVFDNNMPVGDTPTGDSIAVVAQNLANDPAPGRKLIVLATDGEPDTCAEPDPQNGQDESVAAAVAAYDLGVETAVISVGDQITQDHLQDLANAGAGVMAGDPDAPFYQALDQAALLDAFNQVLSGNRSCTFALGESLDPNQVSTCVVTVNGSEVPPGGSDGWQLNGTNEMELVGGACDSIQEGEVEIDMACDCEALGG